MTDAFCAAWTSNEGKLDFDTLAQFLARDADVMIHVGLRRIAVRRMGEVTTKTLADGAMPATPYPFHLSHHLSG